MVKNLRLEVHPLAASAVAAAESAGVASLAVPLLPGWGALSSGLRQQPPCGGAPAAARVCTRPRKSSTAAAGVRAAQELEAEGRARPPDALQRRPPSGGGGARDAARLRKRWPLGVSRCCGRAVTGGAPAARGRGGRLGSPGGAAPVEDCAHPSPRRLPRAGRPSASPGLEWLGNGLHLK